MMEDYWESDNLKKFCENRINHLFKFIDKTSLKNKKVLELGCGWGYIGELLEKEGAIVTSVDARSEYINVIKNKYPHRRRYVVNVDYIIDDPLYSLLENRFDIVVCFGLLYHVENPINLLRLCTRLAPMTYLETATSDNTSEVLALNNKDAALNQSMTGLGFYPSESFIKNIASYLNCDIQNISEGIDWSDNIRRRMFIITRRETW